MKRVSRAMNWLFFPLTLVILACTGSPSTLSAAASPPSPTAPIQQSPPPDISLEGREYTITNPTSGAALYAAIYYPEDWDEESNLPALVLVPGGSGDSGSFVRGRGAPPLVPAITQAGYAAIVFDPDGRGRSEGIEDYDGFVQQDGLAAVIRSAATWPGVDADNIGLVTTSYGITMGAGALARHPDLPVRFLLDWEGPANRDDTGGCDEAGTGHLQKVASCDDEDFWSQREASAFIAQINVPYQRLQSEKDHVQPDNSHAILMINNAVEGGVPWTRLNDLPPNQTYAPNNPPSMLPESTDKMKNQLIIQYAGEMFALDSMAESTASHQGNAISSVPAVFFVVHIETSDHNTQPDSVTDEWYMLEAFVALADRYGYKLTLEFQPQWAEYALARPEALAQIRAWEAAGHEIAVHHHGVSHAAWDGYTNAPGYQNRPEYRGTMDDAMALLNQLPADGVPLTGGMTDEETDWPATLIYATGGLGMSGGGLRSTPAAATYNDVNVTQVSNQGFVLGFGPEATLEEIQAAVEGAEPGEVVGITTHPFNFWEHQDEIETLFQYLQATGIKIQTTSTILSTNP